jgi:hypothetical protein
MTYARLGRGEGHDPTKRAEEDWSIALGVEKVHPYAKEYSRLHGCKAPEGLKGLT